METTGWLAGYTQALKPTPTIKTSRYEAMIGFEPELAFGCGLYIFGVYLPFGVLRVYCILVHGHGQQ